MRRIIVLIAVISLCAPRPCLSCMWDSDTLAMERQKFPEAHELIAGHFLRHSRAFYEWRIADRTAKASEQQRPGDFDDIAVAYDKLGQHDAAIETILSKMERWPDQGQYESEANLGTFLIHAGRFEEGLQHINRAIEINPQAHFGREVYQKLLVEYVIQQRTDHDGLPLRTEELYGQTGFANFVLTSQEIDRTNKEVVSNEIGNAVNGILGMMRFGNHDSPILLEVLGDLLLGNDYADPDGSKMLAARAYLKASYEVDDAAVSEAYQKYAEAALELQWERELPEIEADLQAELAQADEFVQQIATDEASWIAAGKKVDVEFARKYYSVPVLDLNQPDSRSLTPDEISVIGVWVLAGVLVVLIAVAIGIGVMIQNWYHNRQVRRNSTNAP